MGGRLLDRPGGLQRGDVPEGVLSGPQAMVAPHRGKRFLGPYFSYDTPLEVDWVWGAFMFFRSSLLDIYPDKKLTESFFYYEDVEWCYLAKKAGFKTYFDPGPEMG